MSEQHTTPVQDEEVQTGTAQETAADDSAQACAQEEVAQNQKDTDKHKKKAKGKDGKDKATQELQARLDEQKESYLRMAAEYENFRKRSARERESTYADAVSYAVRALLPTYDNLTRALAQPTTDEAYQKGITLTLTQLVEALEGLQVKLIDDAPGVAFDPNLHNAVMHIDDDTLGENVIAETFQRGFLLGDKVIRHSMVKVAN